MSRSLQFFSLKGSRNGWSHTYERQSTLSHLRMRKERQIKHLESLKRPFSVVTDNRRCTSEGGAPAYGSWKRSKRAIIIDASQTSWCCENMTSHGEIAPSNIELLETRWMMSADRRKPRDQCVPSVSLQAVVVTSQPRVRSWAGLISYTRTKTIRRHASHCTQQCYVQKKILST